MTRLVNLIPESFLERVCVVAPRAYVFVVLDCVSSRAFEYLSDHFQLLLLVYLVCRGSWSFVCNSGGVRIAWFSQTWILVVVVTDAWSLRIVNWVVESLNIVRKRMALRYRTWHSYIVKSRIRDSFWFLQLIPEQIMPLYLTTQNCQRTRSFRVTQQWIISIIRARTRQPC